MAISGFEWMATPAELVCVGVDAANYSGLECSCAGDGQLDDHNALWPASSRATCSTNVIVKIEGVTGQRRSARNEHKKQLSAFQRRIFEFVDNAHSPVAG